MLAIYKKELRSYFTSMIGYAFMAFFLIIVGIYFFALNLLFGSANFENTLASIVFLFVLLVPILTMRLMAEENKQKTDQLLYTSPVTATSIVVGKFLSVFTVFLAAVLIICCYPLIMMQFGTISVTIAYSSIFGFAMLGATYLSMGLYISSLTESQVIAAVISFVVFIFTVLMDSLASILPTSNQFAFIAFTLILIIICLVIYLMMKNLTLSVGFGVVVEIALMVIYTIKPTLFDGALVKVFDWLSVTKRFDAFYAGIFDVSGIVYYLSVTFLFIFLTIQVIRKKRWS